MMFQFNNTLSCLLDLLWKLSTVFFSTDIVLFILFFICSFDGFYFFVDFIMLFMYCFPNFVYLCLCSYSLLNLFRRIIFISLSESSQRDPFVKSQLWSFMGFLWLCHVHQILCDLLLFWYVHIRVSGFLSTLQVCFGRQSFTRAQFGVLNRTEHYVPV